MSPEPEDLGTGSKLEKYRAKRSADKTPEPFGGEGTTPRGVFVVQKHAARRTHYDLRLEVDGVLKSWAVPKGPTLDPAEKRLAVETEDHPLEYAEFEGIIPAGNYGAGAMIVWDRGTWVPLEDVEAGYEKGKLLFELRGYKLRGAFTLFRTKRPAIHRGRDKNEDRQWLLMKKPDAASRPAGGEPLPEESVLSGLTVEELRDGPERIEELREAVAAAGAPPGRIALDDFKPMLAQSSDEPFSREGWIFELKYDGYRLLAARDGESVRLRYRNGLDASDIYPEITKALAALPVDSVLLDGEVVVLDADARPSFQGLQKRAMLSRPRDALVAATQLPATYYVFDLLALEGLDLRSLPVVERKAFLRRLLPPAGPLRFSDHVEGQGKELFEQIERMGLEGMVAKEADSRYVGRRSPSWLKFRVDRTGDFVVVGWTAPEGNRLGFASLHLATNRAAPGAAPELVYAGRVGTGFNDAQLSEIAAHLEASERPDPPLVAGAPRGPRHHWVEPDLVCEVRYKEWTDQGLLRHPVFLRLRDDKAIDECTGEASPALPEPEAPEPPAKTAAPKLALTNLDKVFWPEEGYTKGDLIRYYGDVAPAMLPYLKDRPVVLTRYPDGIYGKNFFQKNAPDYSPEWFRTVTIWSEGSEREIEYFVCDDENALVYLANLGSILIHMWSSRLADLHRPDWCILDLDPKEAPFGDVVRVAKAIHALCKEIGLPDFVKTSGSSGLHVLLPLGGAFTYEQSRLLGQLIAQVIVRRLPKIATITRNPQKRDGKVYLDFVQNGHGRLLVAPFSVRPLPGAPVSTPLRWSEVKSGLDPSQFTIVTVPKRLARIRTDPLAGVLTTRPDLQSVLEKLAETVDERG